MAIQDELKKGAKPAKENKKGDLLTDEEETDVDLATAMANVALSMPEVTDSLDQMVQSAEPVLAIGQFIANMVLNIKEQAMTQGLNLSDKIWLAEGGVVDRIDDSVVQNLAQRTGLDLTQDMQKIWIETLNVFKLAAKTGQAAAAKQQNTPPQGAPAPAPVGANIGAAAPAINGGM